jgi:FdhD protein
VSCGEVPTGNPWTASSIPGFVGGLRSAQKSFERTGGLHAAALFDRDGLLRVAREDVGRHNAVDKVVGATLLAQTNFGVNLAEYALVVSGRVSFEIVQKAAVAGLPLLAAVSAPSSLAVDAAIRLGVTRAAFVRGDTFNIYSHPERIVFDQ